MECDLAVPLGDFDVTDDKTDRPTSAPRIRFSRRAAVWLVGAAVVAAATGAAGFVSDNTPTASPTPAADAATSTSNALDAIVAQHPGIGKPIADLVRQGTLPKPTYVGDTGRIGVPKYATLPSKPAGSVVRYVPGSVQGDFNLLQLGALALWAGCSASQAPIAAAIAAAESGGNPGAQGDISLMDGTWDWSQGLWQIRGLHSERGTGELRDSLANADPETNAHAMYTISSGCNDWTPWSTYVSGAYLSYLGMSKTAVLAAKQFQRETGALPAFGADAGPVSVPSTTSSRTASPHPSAHKTKHRSAGPSAHTTAHPTKQRTAAPNNPAPTSQAPAAQPTSKAVAPAPTSSAPKPPSNPISSIISKVPLPTKSVLPSPSIPKLPLPTSTAVKVPLPGTTKTIKVPIP